MVPDSSSSNIPSWIVENPEALAYVKQLAPDKITVLRGSYRDPHSHCIILFQKPDEIDIRQGKIANALFDYELYAPGQAFLIETGDTGMHASGGSRVTKGTARLERLAEVWDACVHQQDSSNPVVDGVLPEFADFYKSSISTDGGLHVDVFAVPRAAYALKDDVRNLLLKNYLGRRLLGSLPLHFDLNADKTI